MANKRRNLDERRPYMTNAEMIAKYGDCGAQPFRLPQYDLTPRQEMALSKQELADMLARLYSSYRSMADECYEVISMKDAAELRVSELEKQIAELEANQNDVA